MASRARAVLVSLAAVGISLVASNPAFANDTACIHSYEQTQTLRRAGKLREARTEAAKCSSETCPAVLARDCAKWLVDLDQSIPTVVFDVKSATGEELTSVRVLIDGKPLVDKIDGASIALDVGPHTFRFESTDEKGLPAEHQTVIREGERNRRISVTLAAPAAVASVPAAKADRPVPIAAWVFGGAAVASLGVGTVFALSGSSKESDLDKCRPSCGADAVNDASTSYAVADILLSAGVVSALAAATIFITRPTVSSAPATSTTGLVRRRAGLTFEFRALPLLPTARGAREIRRSRSAELACCSAD
ncbi:MAG: hypothetical protein BGO98_02955 [Myxococcales bacterium 68-20]|nr:hypothetical protein [Myxococcales bacterium]OJY21792.1 MAG: hypothetical protein BGO98_02955 [Myxococcales bacterium 68-20]